MGALYWSTMAFAAVVSLLATTKSTTVPAYATAPPIWVGEKVNRGLRR
jgi:hypothetical protein